ncbi:MAG: hypothetical protein IJS56_04835 [Bacilli bacterium]|nr:hypothetical protein [Bacilli bacterium]
MSKKFIIAWVFFIVTLLGCFLYIGFNKDKKNNEYYKLENSLKEATSVYMTTNSFNLNNGDSMKIDINDLVPAFTDTKDTKNDKCEGYVLVSKDKNKTTYKTYLTCNNYKTLKD